MIPLTNRLSLRLAAAAGLAALALAAPAAAEAIAFDPTGDFLPTYVGATNDDLDINIAAAWIERGDVLHLASIQDSFIGLTETGAFVWGIDRGAGTEGLVGGSPSLGAGVRFDAIVVLRGNAITNELSGAVTTFGVGGPATTDISADMFVHDVVLGAFIPLSLLPSTGFAAADYKVNLWTRDGADNDHIADFAVDNGMLAVNDERGAVPEPGAWALMITGFGLAGAVLRRRQGAAIA